MSDWGKSRIAVGLIFYGILFVFVGAAKIISGAHNKPPERSALTPVTGVVREVTNGQLKNAGGLPFYELKIEPSNAPRTNMKVTLLTCKLESIQIGENDASAKEQLPRPAGGAASDPPPWVDWDKKAFSLAGLPVTALVYGGLKRQIRDQDVWDLSVGKYQLVDYANRRSVYVQELLRKRNDGPKLLDWGIVLLIAGALWSCAWYRWM